MDAVLTMEAPAAEPETREILGLRFVRDARDPEHLWEESWRAPLPALRSLVGLCQGAEVRLTRYAHTSQRWLAGVLTRRLTLQVYGDTEEGALRALAGELAMAADDGIAVAAALAKVFDGLDLLPPPKMPEARRDEMLCALARDFIDPDRCAKHIRAFIDHEDVHVVVEEPIGLRQYRIVLDFADGPAMMPETVTRCPECGARIGEGSDCATCANHEVV
jgi:hypothetical protein